MAQNGIKRKKKAKPRQNARKVFSLKKFFLLFLTVGITWGGVLLFSPEHFPIRDVKISGDLSYLDPQRLNDIVLQHAQKGFFRVGVSDLKHDLIQIPWIKSVGVRRLWPNQLAIKIVGYTPVARWEDQQFIASEGKLITPTKPLKDLQLVQLSGPLGRHLLVWEKAQAIQAQLKPLGLRLAHLKMAPRGAWELSLDNGIKVVLGREDVMARVERFVLAYEHLISENPAAIEYVDMRYTSGFAVGWKSG